MTIVAGFKCSDGIVLCADSQETINSYLKVNVPKLVTRPLEFKAGDKSRAVFAGSGDGPFVDKLINSMWGAAMAAGADLDEISLAMEEATIAIHERLWQMYSDNNKPEASIIFGIAASQDTKLFRSHGPIVNPVDTYACAGCGDVIAKYICDRLYSPTMDVSQCAILALYVLLHTKRYVEGCGGLSYVVILHNTLEQTIFGELTSDWIEKNLNIFDSCSRDLLLALPNSTINESEFNKILRKFGSGIRGQRRRSINAIDNHWKRLSRQIMAIRAKRR
jgi:hypothetical protein